MKKLITLFNHSLTDDQTKDAQASLKVREIISIPEDIRRTWGQVPPDLPEISDYLAPVRQWLTDSARPGDYVLIHGDFGASYIMVRFAFESGLVPVYATTQRESLETRQPDGTVKKTAVFKHVQFRKYNL